VTTVLINNDPKMFSFIYVLTPKMNTNSFFSIWK